MRDRLIDLILKTPPKVIAGGRANGRTYQTASNIADHLLANGVIVPPCKVGDRVYVDEDTWGLALYYDNCFIHSKYFIVGEIVSIIKTKKQLLIKIRVSNSIHTRYRHKRYPASAIGKTVFLTREEAEAKLKGEQ